MKKRHASSFPRVTALLITTYRPRHFNHVTQNETKKKEGLREAMSLVTGNFDLRPRSRIGETRQKGQKRDHGDPRYTTGSKVVIFIVFVSSWCLLHFPEGNARLQSSNTG
ncbi:hypothetical protein C8R42DRAFT_719518 [Lentinula raphanica]|nr:hypothetical protein C8R42DRAFT_719518 [Lentinula raphanica]